MSESQTVLIIDDDEADRALYRAWLEQGGHDVSIVEAEDGEAGYKAYQECSPSCIVLDFLMTNGDGFEYLSKMRSRTSKFPPVVFLTGFHSPEIAEDALALGAYTCLNKADIDAAILNDVIENALAEHRQAS